MQLPSHWKVVKLREVAKIERGKFTHRPRNDPAFYGGDIPFIQTGDVTASNGRIKTYSQTLNEKGLSVSKIFPKGTIVITIAANIGYTGILEFNSAFPDNLIRITPTNETINIDNEYLNYYLWTQQTEMDRQAPRGTQKNINIQFLHPWLVVIPPLPEQRAIAHTLRTIQKANEVRQRELELERECKAALMQYLFTHGTHNEPSKQTEIGEIPKTWQVVKLEKFIKDGPQNGIYKPLELYGAGIPIVRINDFDNNGAFVTFNFQRVSLSSDEASKYRIAERDILINRVNSLSHLGKCALVPKLEETTVFESNMMRFHVDETRLMPEYLFRYLVTTECRNYLRSIAKRAVAQSSINQGDVKSLLIPVPNLSEQAEITSILSAVDRKITALEKK